MSSIAIRPNTYAVTELPASYEAAKHALQVCVSVDECKDIADKAVAMRAYARQIKDQTLVFMAIRIRARAMRRMGELLMDTPKGNALARDLGMTAGQATMCRQIARVVEPKFEELVETTPPNRADLIAKFGVGDKERQVRHAEAAYLSRIAREEYDLGETGVIRGLTEDQINAFFEGMRRIIYIKTGMIKPTKVLHFDKWRYCVPMSPSESVG